MILANSKLTVEGYRYNKRMVRKPWIDYVNNLRMRDRDEDLVSLTVEPR